MLRLQAEDVSMYYRKELERFIEAIKYKYNSKHDLALLRKTLAVKGITDLPPQEEQSLLLCLKSKTFPSRVLDENRCQEYLSKWYKCNDRPRRLLIRRHHQRQWRRHIRPDPRTLSSAGKETSQSAPWYFSRKVSRILDSPQGKRALSRPGYRRRGNSKTRGLLIGIIVATSVATLALFAILVLLCCRDEKRIRSKERQRDKKPLPDTCPNDVPGSSQTSQAVGSNNDSINCSVSNNFSATNFASMAGGQTSEIGTLPLPPGRTALLPPRLQAPPPSPAPSKPPASKAPPPPPPPRTARPPTPSKAGKPPPVAPTPPSRRDSRGRSAFGDENDRVGASNGHKTKLKPFFWDKVNTNPNHTMVWHELRAGSFQFNEEMMEDLFGYTPAGQDKNERGKSLSSEPKFIQIIDPKKAQNLAILLKALNLTIEEVRDALEEGHELPVDFLLTLIKMAPSQDEEQKFRSYNGDVALLGPAERFLKVVVEIPFAFKRFECLFFMSSLPEEYSSIKDCFLTLEVACTKLKNSRLFMKLLEAVLKTGNRMNDGTFRGGAQAFTLNTLLKLSDVKGTDGKTTLLSFVVQEIVRSEGVKAAWNARPRRNFSSVEEKTKEKPEYYRKVGLEVVLKLSEELEDVKKAALIDGDTLTSTVLKLGNMLTKTKDFLSNEMKTVEEGAVFCDSLNGFVERAEADIVWMLEEEKKIAVLVKSTGDYFHGKSGKDEGLRLFVIVRDFLILLDKTCNELRKTYATQTKNHQKKETTASTGAQSPEDNREQSVPNFHYKLFPAIREKRIHESSSDDESLSS